MPQWLATLFAALIGAGAGSIGAVVTAEKIKRRAARTERREAVVQRYLYQLQDTIESLWYRLDNVAYDDGKLVMPDDYFETTTLYALGRALGVERLISLDGAFPEVERLYPGLGEFLMDHRVDNALGEGFFKYDRITLAEAVMETTGDRFRASTYLEFRRRYESGATHERAWLAPARDAVQNLEKEQIEELIGELRKIAEKIAEQASIASGLPEDDPNAAASERTGIAPDDSI